MLFAVWSAYQLVLPASVGSSTDISLPFLSQLELLATVCPFHTARGKASFVLCGDCFTASQLQENPASTISGPTYLTGGRCNHSLPFCLILASVLPFPNHSVTASWPSVFMFFVFPRNVTSTGFQLWTITSFLETQVEPSLHEVLSPNSLLPDNDLSLLSFPVTSFLPTL